MRKKYIFITGATGFIGSHVAEKLLNETDYKLVAPVRKTTARKNKAYLAKRGVILFEGNFYDENLIETIFAKYPIHSVIHLAALRGGGAGSRKAFYKINVQGTENLIQKSIQHRVNRFLFCSSVGVFGTIPKELPANLKTQTNADNAYHKSKILAERKIKESVHKGLDAFIVRPTITYGTEDNGFPLTLTNLVKRRIMPLPLNDTMIHLLDVSSLADVFLKILQAKRLEQRIFIAADSAPISLSELVNTIHLHYYKMNYPQLLRLPNSFFQAMSRCARLLKSERWHTRFSLISKNWYYDISETIDSLNFVPSDTKRTFITTMCT